MEDRYKWNEDFAASIDIEGFDYFFNYYIGPEGLPTELGPFIEAYHAARGNLCEALRKGFKEHGVSLDEMELD